MRARWISGRRPAPLRPVPWRWPAALAVAASLAALALGTAPLTASAAAGDSPFFRAVSRLDNALRVAIEDQPEGLTKSLGASERICSLGALAEERGDAAAAAADWSTLTQVVQLLDEPGLRGVEEAFGRAASTLAGIEARFGRAWRGQQRVKALHVRAAAVRGGIRAASAALQPLRKAFAEWIAHRCEAALAETDTSGVQISAAVGTIARGMERLWIFAITVSSH